MNNAPCLNVTLGVRIYFGKNLFLPGERFKRGENICAGLASFYFLS